MAGGYLGKISAVISANTGDYVRGLNEGAKATRDFARTVQSTLNRSATEAARAFEGIYTPLQQFERAIRQAGALRLNFKGFEGAVRNINDLQKRLNGVLTNNEIDLVVRTSGLKDIEAVRQAINSLSQKEITLTSNAGGLPGLLKARAELQASGGADTLILNTKATQAELDALIQKLNVLDDRRIELIIDVVNQRGLEEAITRARRLQEVATQIAAPLSASAAEFTKLSQAAQGQFAPALGAAQRAVEQFQADVEQLGVSGRGAFQGLKADVDIVRAAISRLSEAQALTSRLFTGQELNFVNPEIVDTLRRVQDAQQQLASSPAAVRGSTLGRELIADAQILQEQLNRVQARIERIRAEGGDITFSQRGLDVILRRLRQAAEETERLSARGGGLDFVAAQGNPAGQFGPSRPFTTLPPNFFANRQSEIDARNARAAAADRARSASAFLPPVLGSESAAISDPRAFQRQTFGAGLGSASRQFDALRSGIQSVKAQIGELPASVQSQFIPAIQRAEREFVRLAAAPNGLTGSLARAQAQLETIRASVKRVSEAQQFASGFGGAGVAGLNFGIDQRTIRGIGAEIEFLQGKLTAYSETARGPAVAAIERFRNVAVSAFRAGTLGTEATTKSLQLARDEVVRLTAAVANVKPGRLADQLKRVGDVARGSFGNAGLAIQQAAFAIDDFFSATGGLDQRIRAAGNNISQLGFIVGGTFGLGIGIGVSLISQLIAALIRWSGASKEAERRQRELQAAVDSVNSALERQRQKVEEIAQAYKSLAREIRTTGLSERQQEELRRKGRLEDIQKTRDERRKAAAEATDTAVGRTAGQIAGIDEELKKEQNAGRRVELTRRRRELEARRDSQLAAIEQQGADSAGFLIRNGGFDNARAVLEGEAEKLRRQLAETQKIPDAALANKFAERISRSLAVVENALQRVIDAAQDRVFELQQGVSDSFARAQQRVKDIEGVRTFESTIAETLRLQEELTTAFESGTSFAAIQELFDGFNKLAAAVEQTAIGLSSLSGAMEKAAGALAETVERELGTLEERLRRDANASQARFGAGDFRTSGARQAERTAREELQRAQDARNSIRERESELRQRFEVEAMNGQMGGRAAEIVSRIRDIDAMLARTSTSPDDAVAQESARLERIRLQAELDRLFAAAPDVADLRRRADELDIEAQKIVQRIESEARGRELMITPRERSAEDFARQMADIQSATDALVQAEAAKGQFGDVAGVRARGADAQQRLVDRALATADERAALDLRDRLDQIRGIADAEVSRLEGLGQFGGADDIRARAAAAINQEREDAFRQAAPTIFGLADQVANAVLQGPSRAALAPVDVTTMEGSRELTRLLRGDDAARNQDLVSLQREANRLLKMIADNPAGIAP